MLDGDEAHKFQASLFPGQNGKNCLVRKIPGSLLLLVEGGFW